MRLEPNRQVEKERMTERERERERGYRGSVDEMSQLRVEDERGEEMGTRRCEDGVRDGGRRGGKEGGGVR